MKKILILYTSVGLGHKYIALNMGYHLEQAGYEVKLADILQVQSGPLVDFGEWVHSLINRRFPFIWRWLYLSKIFAKVTMPFRVPLAGRNCDHVKQLIEEFHPDMVIATQTSASAPMAYLKKTNWYKGLFVIAFSDYHFHPYWWYDESDHYLVNIEEQKNELVHLGVDEKQISVIGITLKPIVKVDVESVKQSLGLANNKVILVASGSLGIGFSQKLLLEFAKQMQVEDGKAKLVVVTGKNEALKTELESIFRKENIDALVLGFYEPFENLLAIADVFLTKPGGLTTAEALRNNTKMITTHFLPGQEELNYKYLTNRRLIFPIPNPKTAKNLVTITRVIMDGNKNVENPNSEQLTQKNNEGALLIKSIENLFHNV